MTKVTMTDVVEGIAVDSSAVTVTVTEGVGTPGRGVAAGGTTGQVLAKASDTDFDTEWVDQTGGTGSVSSDDITDATTVGKAVLTATDAATARTAIGAGTSSLAIGTTSSTAKAGNYAPAAADISDATTVGKSVLTAADAASARTAIGAGTSSLVLGTTSTTALAGDTTVPADLDDLSDVDTSTTAPTDGQVLTWVDADSKWEPADATGGSGATTLDDLTDVDTTTTAPTDGQALVYDSGTSLWVPGDVSSGGSSTVKDPRWNVLTGQTSIDEFNDSSLDSAWVRVDGTGAASGNLVIVEDGDVVSLSNQGGDSTSVLHGLVRPLTGAGGAMSVGDGFITCVRVAAPANTRYSINGLILTDSTSIGSGKQATVDCNIVDASGSGVNAQPYSSWNTPGTPTSLVLANPYLQGPVFLRLSLVAANTWRGDASLDCVNWLIGPTFSQTFTPTHVGFLSSSYGTSTKSIATYEFLRRVSGVS